MNKVVLACLMSEIFIYNFNGTVKSLGKTELLGCMQLIILIATWTGCLSLLPSHGEC